MYTHLCTHYFYFIISSLATSARRAEPLLTGTEISAYSWKHSYFNQTTLPIFHSSFYSPAFVKSANQPARSFPSPITSFFALVRSFGRNSSPCPPGCKTEARACALPCCRFAPARAIRFPPPFRTSSLGAFCLPRNSRQPTQKGEKS